MGQLTPSSDRFVFTSSTADEAWHPDKRSDACEWWYFDALSDDGNEAVAVVFLDNFIYASGPDRNGGPGGNRSQTPAISFTYFAGGRAICRAKAEFSASEFSAQQNTARCSIGASGFRFDSASYGSGYLVSVDLPLPRGRRLRANLEWLSIEADLAHENAPVPAAVHRWNMVAPRSDVSGKITIEDPSGRVPEVHSFRGTGYHDHHIDEGWLTSSVTAWQWGRAHFADQTAIFCRFSETDRPEATARLLLTGDTGIRTLEAALEPSPDGAGADGHAMSLTARDGERRYRLTIRPLKAMDSNFFRQRYLGLITLAADGREHSVNGITEYISPRILRHRWLGWLSGLRRR